METIFNPYHHLPESHSQPTGEFLFCFLRKKSPTA